MRIKPELTISVAAFVLSIIATASSMYFASIGLKTTVLPALVFVYDSDINSWALRNVGNGPAPNVTVAHQAFSSDDWVEPTRLYPVSEGESVLIGWVGSNPDKLAATYTDAHNRQYTSVTDEDLTKIDDGNLLPIWEDDAVGRIWQRGQ